MALAGRPTTAEIARAAVELPNPRVYHASSASPLDGGRRHK